MPNVKISELANTTLPLTGAELVPVVQNSETRKVTVANILDTKNPRIVLDTASPGALVEGSMRWNATSKTVEVGAGNVTLQLGLEKMIWVKNSGPSAISNGKVVGFISGDLSTKLPTAQHFVADGSYLQIQLIGIATEDISNGATGRVTTEGEVHDINTTGSTYGESWAAGDILYAHPTTAGGLTKVRPAPPALAIPVAAVTYAHATAGVMLVRPTLNQRMYYGDFSSSSTQSHASVNTPKAVALENTGVASGISIGTPNSRITFANSGAYQLRVSLQFKKSNTGADNAWFWLRKNGSDVANSGTKVELAANGYDFATKVFQIAPASGDYFEIVWAVDDTSISLEPAAAQASPFVMPACPSVAVSAHQVNQ